VLGHRTHLRCDDDHASSQGGVRTVDTLTGTAPAPSAPPKGCDGAGSTCDSTYLEADELKEVQRDVPVGSSLVLVDESTASEGIDARLF